MRNSIVIFIAVFMLACETKQEFSAATVQGLAELPATAIKEPYESNPDLVKVTINQNGETESGDYLAGKRNGTWTVFHNNGLVKSITGYVNGVKQGTYTEIDNRGQLQISAYYHNDELHGDWKKFNRSRVKEERVYNNGKLEGIAKVYYDDGKIMEEGSYANGVRDGVSKWYDQEGNISIEYEYNRGELVNQ